MSLQGLLILDIVSGRPYVVVEDYADHAVAKDLVEGKTTYKVFKDEVGRLKGVGELFVILGHSKYLYQQVMGGVNRKTV